MKPVETTMSSYKGREEEDSEFIVCLKQEFCQRIEDQEQKIAEVQNKYKSEMQEIQKKHEEEIESFRQRHLKEMINDRKNRPLFKTAVDRFNGLPDLMKIVVILLLVVITLYTALGAAAYGAVYGLNALGLNYSKSL